MNPAYIYFNYDMVSGAVRFVDILPASRVYGSNETEDVVTDPGDIAFEIADAEKNAHEIVPLSGGLRYYF